MSVTMNPLLTTPESGEERSEGSRSSPAPAAPIAVKIRVQDLNFYYGKLQALHGVTLNIAANHITALIGPSGCGKSTFLRSLNRMHEMVRHARAEGQILLDGENALTMEVSQLRRRVGMVFQKSNPFPKSIFDNVAYGLRVNGRKGPGTLEEAVERSLVRAALWEEVKDKLHKSAYALSGGQQQRLCIARALAVDPEVLLLDELCSVLDPIATAKIEELLFDLKKQCTIVIVTHNMQQAARVADSTGFFLMGKLIEFDDTAVIFKTPAKKETEDYITGRFGYDAGLGRSCRTALRTVGAEPYETLPGRTR
jgi:phosphate transport system ATP-binding protein